MNQTSSLMDMVVRSAQICALVVCLAGKMNKINSKYSGFIILNKMFNVKKKKKKKDMYLQLYRGVHTYRDTSHKNEVCFCLIKKPFLEYFSPSSIHLWVNYPLLK